MTELDREQLLGDCLEEYHRRRALGERPAPEEWKDWLGEHYEEFREIILAASAIDDLIEPAPPSDTLPRSFGDYTLLKLLGRGAMGMVYEAVHRGLGRKVALKILRSGFEDEPQAYERFKREAQACAQIQHDHIVSIYESGQEDGRPYYSMPVLEGRSLSELIRDGDVPAPGELCRGLADVADALQTMHEAGIIHRDIKPANIMVETGGRMILADFGLARTAASQSLTATGQALGTPLYMSPEQLLGRKEDIDGSSDVYGLGVTLYEALAGRPPFKADDVSGLMKMILSDRPRPLPQVVPDAPVECSHIAMKAMEKKPSDRYPTAAAMRDDLRAFAEGGRVEGRPVSKVRHTVRKHRWRLLAAAAALLVSAGLGFWFFTRDATLSVVSFPVADVMVDGEAIGTTPLRIALAPGAHDLSLRQAGFGERRHRIDLSAGENRSIETALIASDAEDPEALRRIGEELGVALREFEESERTRGAKGGPPVQILYPRGDVRLADLDLWRVDVPDEMYDADGHIEFRRGDEVLARIHFIAEETWTFGDIPDEVRSALTPGDEVEWGYSPLDEADDQVTATFRVIEDPLADRLAEIEKRLADQPAAVVSHLKTQIYLDHGLHLAAVTEARRAIAESPESDRAWGGMLEAVKAMGLEETLLYREVRDRFDRRPQ